MVWRQSGQCPGVRPGPAGESVCDDSQHKRFADLHFWRTPQANCASQPRCVPYATWAKDYARIVAGR